MEKLAYSFLPALISLGILLFSQVAAQPEKSLLVESIEIQGNSKTKTSVIENYLTIKEGRPVTREQLDQNQIRLQETNFFKEVEMLIMPGSEKGTAKVVLKVRERRWPFFQIKGGFNELDGWYISPLGIRFDNIFGRGNFLGFEFIIGDRIGGARLDFVKPYLWGSEYDFRIQLFGYKRDFVHFIADERYKQEVQDGGALLQVSGNSGLAKYFSLTYLAQQMEADSFLTRDNSDTITINTPQNFNSLPGRQKLRRFILTAKVDTRNRSVNPSLGWWGSISFGQSSKNLDSFVDFTKVIVDIRRYQSLWKEVIGAVRLKGGTVSEEAPFYEKFYLGGPNSLRGYDDRRLTPEGYAANLALASAELRFPLSAKLKDKNRLTGVLFYDAGYAWNKPDKWAIRRVKTGLGAGVRVKLPIVGIVRLDAAYPVPEYEFHLHLSLGHTF